MPKVNEWVFLHRASRALLVCDAVFNVTDSRGPGAWIILSTFGTYRKLGVSRLFTMMIKDRPAFEASLKQLAGLEFDHLVPTHGHIVSQNARTAFLEALEARGFHV